MVRTRVACSFAYSSKRLRSCLGALDDDTHVGGYSDSINSLNVT